MYINRNPTTHGVLVHCLDSVHHDPTSCDLGARLRLRLLVSQVEILYQVHRYSTSRSTLTRGSCYCYMVFFVHTSTFQLFSRQGVVTGGVVPSSPRFLPSISIAHRVRSLLVDFSSSKANSQTHALLALYASLFVLKKTSLRFSHEYALGGLGLRN